MAVFQTAGEPPSLGSTSLAIIGSTMNTRAAEVKMARAKSGGAIRAADGGAPSARLACDMEAPFLDLTA